MVSTRTLSYGVALLAAGLISSNQARPRPANFASGFVQVTDVDHFATLADSASTQFERFRDSKSVAGTRANGWLLLTTDVGVPVLVGTQSGVLFHAERSLALWTALETHVQSDGLVELSKLPADENEFILDFLGYGKSAPLIENKSSGFMLTCEAELIDEASGESTGHRISETISQDESKRRRGALADGALNVTKQVDAIRQGKEELVSHPSPNASYKARRFKDETDAISAIQDSAKALSDFLDPLLEKQEYLQDKVASRLGGDVLGVEEGRAYTFEELPPQVQRSIRASGTEGNFQNNPGKRYRFAKRLMLNIMVQNGEQKSWIARAID